MLKKVLILMAAIQLTACDELNKYINLGDALSNGDIITGLKDALTQGTNNGTSLLAKKDGFFKNAAVKILLPAEAQNVANKLTQLGFGNLVDGAIEKINRAAEDAATKAGPIFVNSIKQMTFTDAKNILMGKENAATDFFRRTTSTSLYNAFQPTIKASLNKVGALDAWEKVISTYNKLPLVTQVNPKLDDHVTKKAIDGVFLMVEKEEKDIRKNPAKRLTAMMKKVFKAQDK